MTSCPAFHFDMHFSLPSRIREFRHCFSGTRLIVATVRVDLSRVRFEPRSTSCIRCEWEGSRVKQPSSELFEEYRAWMHHVLSIVVSQTGTLLLYVFEAPAPVKEIELWLYRNKRQPRLLKTLPNPYPKPLSEVIAGMPPTNWEEVE